MDGKGKIKVNEIKERPAKLEGYCMISRGIRTKEAAEQWGAKYEFPTVYWIKAEEKVYGVKAAVAVSGQQLAVSSESMAEVAS